VLQLTRSGPALSWTEADLRRLRTQFDERHCIRLPSLIDADEFAYVQRQFDRAVFADKRHGNIGVEVCMQENPALNLLNFLTNDDRFFHLVEQLTGCGPIGTFVGRVYRMIPGSGHYDSWHSDFVEHRMIGMSLNLSDDEYSGGVFQLRPKESDAILIEAPNTGAGDAILFRIASDIVHRVTEVEGTVPKTAFAGWFVSEPKFLDLLVSRRADDRSIATAE
jgi:2OG-Fe(II) oxygenase superfamily